MLFIIIFINSAQSVTINTVPCTCPQLLSQKDCERQTKALGCSWSLDDEICTQQDCQLITDQEQCNNISFCGWTRIGTCTQFYKAICNYFNSTSLGGDCMNKQCQNNTLNIDGTYTCKTILYDYTELECGTQVNQTLCEQLLLCNWNSTSLQCGDKSCSDYPPILCTVSFNTLTLPIAAYPCHQQNDECADVDQIYDLDESNCNKNTLNTYTWNPSAVECQICNIFGNAISAIMIFMFFY